MLAEIHPLKEMMACVLRALSIVEALRVARMNALGAIPGLCRRLPVEPGGLISRGPPPIALGRCRELTVHGVGLWPAKVRPWWISSGIELRRRPPPVLSMVDPVLPFNAQALVAARELLVVVERGHVLVDLVHHLPLPQSLHRTAKEPLRRGSGGGGARSTAYTCVVFPAACSGGRSFCAGSYAAMRCPRQLLNPLFVLTKVIYLLPLLLMIFLWMLLLMMMLVVVKVVVIVVWLLRVG